MSCSRRSLDRLQHDAAAQCNTLYTSYNPITATGCPSLNAHHNPPHSNQSLPPTSTFFKHHHLHLQGDMVSVFHAHSSSSTPLSTPSTTSASSSSSTSSASKSPTYFPTYLFRSHPFRRRSPRTDESLSEAASLPTTHAQGPTTPPSPTYSPPSAILTCTSCRTHLTPATSIISKTFTGRHGRAYLLTPASFGHDQVVVLPPQQRQLATGTHTVCDFACRVCGETLGMKTNQSLTIHGRDATHTFR